ncbi:MAG: DUF3078 domain-containing protein [Prevotellaceae bacterium]|nr:DUF3078 domain-containing protein [Prevotellaceae bacterium]
MLISIIGAAQEKVEKKPKYWLFPANNINLKLTQASYSHWAAGGEKMVSGTFWGRLNANYAKAKVSWTNFLDFGYGLTYKGSDKSKINDKVEINSRFGYKALKKIDYTVSWNLRSQFDKGYAKYPAEKGTPYTSKFMSPAYSELGIGFAFKPRVEFAINLAPIGGKMTFVRDDSLSKVGVYGVKPGKHSYYEFGARLDAHCVNYKIRKNITMNSYLGLFSNLLHNPDNIDVRWNFSLNFIITKYISSTLSLEAIYDDDIKNNKSAGPILQFKQMLDIGFSYNF